MRQQVLSKLEAAMELATGSTAKKGQLKVGKRKRENASVDSVVTGKRKRKEAKQSKVKSPIAAAPAAAPNPDVAIGSPVGGPHSAGEIRGAAAVNVLSRVFAFAAHGGALGWEWR
jgi:hypothetical protein